MKYLKGDIFNSGADVIIHQVNCQGIMGSGVAKQVKEKFPEAFADYHNLCQRYKNNKSVLLGYSQYCLIGDTYIVNLFAQESFGYDGAMYTSYDAMRRGLSSINKNFAGKSVAIPYLMGCCRGGGDWDVVSTIIEEELTDCDVTIYEFNKD